MTGKIRIAALLKTASLILGVGMSARGQTPIESNDDYLQTVWTTENGLPQNSITSILQTPDGYLWLGTFGGLARFDGVRFTTFSTVNTPGMKSNRILTLCESKNGMLWMGTESGEVMSYKDGVATTYTTRDGLPGGYVWACREDSAGTLWIGTQHGLERFRNGRFTPVGLYDGLPATDIWSINEETPGRLWLATNAGLVRFEGGKFTTSRPPGGTAAGFSVPLCEHRKGGYWMGADRGLAYFKDGRFVLYPTAPGPPPLRTAALMEDREGTLWISYFKPAITSRFVNGRHSLYPLKSGTAVVRSMYEDREGNLWMGSDGGGLVRLKRRRVTTYTAKDGLLSDSVRAVSGDGARGLWVTTAAGLSHWSAGKFTTYTDRNGMPSSNLTALCRSRTGDLWIGSNTSLMRFRDGRFTNYTVKQGLSYPLVHAIMEDRDGAIWVGTGDGLNCLRDGKFTVWRHSDGLVHNDVRFIAQARDGGLWIGTVGGLSRFKDGAFTNYTSREGLSNDYVRAILEDPDGGLWLGTYGGGLNYFHHGPFVQITAKQGLPDDFISRLLEDGHGNIWILGNRGIVKVGLSRLHDFVEGRARSISTSSYGVADGMNSSEGNGGDQPAGWQAADGKLWFPTIKGVVALDPNESSNLRASVAIEEVLIDGQSLLPGAPVRVEPDRENLEIHYTGLTLSRPEQVRFNYQLVGSDTGWVDAGTRRTAYYSHLPPGDYIFKVIADNGDGMWNREGAELRVVAVPPFYRTWWFEMLGLLSAAGVVWVAWRYRVSRFERAQAIQQAFSRQLIASQENERRRIAADLHDGLGQRLVVVRNLALFFLRAQGEAAVSAGKVREIEEISAEASLAIQETREISYNLRPFQLDRLGLTKAVEAIVRTVSNASETRFSSEIDNIDDVFPEDLRINFYRIVQECLNNIVKHAHASEAAISVKRTAERVTLTVRDNGKGFTRGTVGSESGQNGVGLTGVAERARLLGGALTMQTAPGHGAVLSVQIHCGRNGHG
jgi:signal transduction histidine kinase/ligand-binding sensor domain-containing protein